MGVLVAGQHESGGGGLAQSGRHGSGVVVERRGCGGDIAQRADPGGEAQQSQHLVVDEGLFDLALAYGGDQRVAPRADRAGHHQVERGAGGRLGGAGGEPVRHHQPVEVPVVVQHLAQQRALRHRVPVDPVVRGHHGPDLALADDPLERRQVQLPQGAFTDPRVERHALGLRVVADEVLDGGRHAAALNTLHIGHADAGGEQRVLAEALEVPSAVRGSVQVHGGGEEDVDTLAARLMGEQSAEPFDQGLVPGGGERGGRGHVGGGAALVPQLTADSGGSVRDDQPAQTYGGFGVEGPEVGAGQQPHLLLQGERAEAPGELGFVGRGGSGGDGGGVGGGLPGHGVLLGEGEGEVGAVGAVGVRSTELSPSRSMSNRTSQGPSSSVVPAAKGSPVNRSRTSSGRW